MTETVEVAIELALLDRAQEFAAIQNLSIALPDIAFTPPTISKTAKYLRASFMPAETVTLSVGSGSDQHHGLLQLDVVCGAGGGETAPARIAAAAISYFIRETRMSNNGFDVKISKTPYRGPQLRDGAWTFIPVRIPYLTFAIPV